MSVCGLPAHKVFQHGALACALTAHHSNLGQVEVAALPHAAQGILKSVDQRDQILHPAVAHRNRSRSLSTSLESCLPPVLVYPARWSNYHS